MSAYKEEFQMEAEEALLIFLCDEEGMSIYVSFFKLYNNI